MYPKLFTAQNGFVRVVGMVRYIYTLERGGGATAKKNDTTRGGNQM